MRHQFWADRKDCLKWTIALDEAGPRRSILHVAMLRPDHGPHGRDHRLEPKARLDVHAFFERERRLGRKDIRRIRILGRWLERVIVVLAAPYSDDGRVDYFDDAVRRLPRRPSARRDLVLVDPDNGIAGARPKSEHVRPGHLSLLWGALRPGDVLVVYQTASRGLVSRRLPAMAAALGIDPARIRVHAFGDVAFFAASRE